MVYIIIFLFGFNLKIIDLAYLARILEKYVENHRKTQGINAKTSFCIADAQNVKNIDCDSNKGYDTGKKISGIKRHILVDILGLPHAILITTVNITNRKGAFEAITQNISSLLKVESNYG